VQINHLFKEVGLDIMPRLPTSMLIGEARHRQAFSVSAMELQKLEHSTVHDGDSALE